MTSPSALRAVVMAGLLVFAGACKGKQPPPSDPSAIVVVEIGDRVYTLEEFEVYLGDNLAADEELDDRASEAAAVKSRLFDAFVEERLLLSEADRREIQISDFEVEAYLGLADASDGRQHGDRSVTRSDWREARRRLKIETLLEAEVSRLPPPPETTVPPRPADEQGGSRRVRLRSLMLETPEIANKVWRDLNQGRVTFNEAVVSHATAPEQGLPIELSFDSLSKDHRQALEKLKPGQFSRPLEVGGGTYLFQVEAWLSGDRGDPDVLAEESRHRTERARRAEAVRALVARLRKSVEIAIHPESLPFAYSEEIAARQDPGIE